MRTRRYRSCEFVFAALLALCGNADGFNEQVTISTTPTGTTRLTLSGIVYCNHRMGDTSATIAPPALFITTATESVICLRPIPSFDSYVVSVDVGFLPEGHWTAAWTFNPPTGSLAGGATSFDFAFDVNVARQPQPVPALDTRALMILVLLTIALGFVLRPGSGESRAPLTTRSTGPAGTGLLLGERRWRRAG
jgi:hypothetical protein